jgi:hypothetical protein
MRPHEILARAVDWPVRVVPMQGVQGGGKEARTQGREIEMTTKPKWWKKATARFVRLYCCTYGNDSDITGDADLPGYSCGKHPVVVVDRDKHGVGRCAKHAPEDWHVPSPRRKGGKGR